MTWWSCQGTSNNSCLKNHLFVGPFARPSIYLSVSLSVMHYFWTSEKYCTWSGKIRERVKIQLRLFRNLKAWVYSMIPSLKYIRWRNLCSNQNEVQTNEVGDGKESGPHVGWPKIEQEQNHEIKNREIENNDLINSDPDKKARLKMSDLYFSIHKKESLVKRNEMNVNLTCHVMSK